MVIKGRSAVESNQSSSERGIALVLVLWVITLLTIIAMGLTATQQTETALIRNQVDTVRFRALSDAAIAYTAVNMGADQAALVGTEIDPWLPDGQSHRWQFAGEILEIRVFNESSRINLNQMSRELIETLLRLVDVAPEEASLLAGAILDWRGQNGSIQLDGAEDSDYSAANLPYGVKNGPFDSVAELRQVIGMTPDIYRKMAPALTVDTDTNRIEERYASPLVLATLRGLALEEAERVVEERMEQVLAAAGTTGSVNRAGPLFRVQVTWLVDDGQGRAMQALLSVTPGQKELFRILWRQFGLDSA